jgi:hypothetical protein
MLALKGKCFDDIITIRKQFQAKLLISEYRTSANVFNNGANTGSLYEVIMGLHWKGDNTEYQVNTVMIYKKYNQEISW